MKQCKGFCRKHNKKNFEFCCDEQGNKILVQFGTSPGRDIHNNKHCTVCTYWIKTNKTKCFCCKNVLKIRKNWNAIDVVYDFLFNQSVLHEHIQPHHQTKLSLVLQEITTK